MALVLITNQMLRFGFTQKQIDCCRNNHWFSNNRRYVCLGAQSLTPEWALRL